MNSKNTNEGHDLNKMMKCDCFCGTSFMFKWLRMKNKKSISIEFEFYERNVSSILHKMFDVNHKFTNQTSIKYQRPCSLKIFLNYLIISP